MKNESLDLAPKDDSYKPVSFEELKELTHAETEKADRISRNPDSISQLLWAAEKTKRIETIWGEATKRLTEYVDPAYTQLGINPFAVKIERISEKGKVDMSPRENSIFLRMSPSAAGISIPYLGRPKVALPTEDLLESVKELTGEKQSAATRDIDPKARLYKLLTNGTFGDLVTITTHEIAHENQHGGFITKKAMIEAQAWDIAGNSSPVTELRLEQSLKEEEAKNKVIEGIATAYNIPPETMREAFGLVETLNGTVKAIELKEGSKGDVKNRLGMVGKYGGKDTPFTDFRKALKKLQEEHNLTPEEIEQGTEYYKTEAELRRAKRTIVTNEILQEALSPKIEHTIEFIARARGPVGEPLRVTKIELTPDCQVDFEAKTADGYYPMLISIPTLEKLAAGTLDKETMEGIVESDAARLEAAVQICKHMMRNPATRSSEVAFQTLEAYLNVEEENFPAERRMMFGQRAGLSDKTTRNFRQEFHINRYDFVFPFQIAIVTGCHIKEIRDSDSVYERIYVSKKKVDQEIEETIPEEILKSLDKIETQKPDNNYQIKSDALISIRTAIENYGYLLYKKKVETQPKSSN